MRTRLPRGAPAHFWPTRSGDVGHPCPFDAKGRLTPQALEWDRYLERAERRGQQISDHLQQHGDFDGFDEPPLKPPEPDWDNLSRVDHHYCFPRGFTDGPPWEPVSAWREWAQRAYALLAVAAALGEGKRGVAQDWHAATGSERWERPRTTEDGWRDLRYMANYWLGAARVRPWLQFDGDRVHMMLGSGGGNSPLFGAIAIQLTLAISGPRGSPCAMPVATSTLRPYPSCWRAPLLPDLSR